MLLALVDVAIYFQQKFDWAGYDTGRLEDVTPIEDDPEPVDDD